MLTARQQEADIIRGFDFGADEYMIKLFRMRELLVRMRAVLRRAVLKDTETPCLAIGDMSLEIAPAMEFAKMVYGFRSYYKNSHRQSTHENG